MKRKNWIALAIIVAACVDVSIAGNSPIIRDKRFVDSNDVIVLSVDSAALAGKTTHADTTYYPSVNGYNFNYMDQLLLKYGVAFLDSSCYHVGAVEDDSGHSFVWAAANDSGHIGVALETSQDGAYWVIAFEDSTIRAAASSRSTSSHLMDVSGMMSDTLMGGAVRIRYIIYRDVDSTETNAYRIADTIWLDEAILKGFSFEE